MSNSDQAELANFNQQAATWWDVKGPMRALHHINGPRVRYIEQCAGGLKGKRALDVGCGGGLLTEALAAKGIPAQVLGFREHASWAVTSDTLGFVDLEDIPGVFREPLPRVSLESLPDEGAWLQPFRPLSALLTSRPGQGVA